MYIFLAILIVIACILLIGVVLIQKSKGGGLASDYSGGNQYLGYRKTTDFIEKATWTLAIFVCVISIFASFAMRGWGGSKSAIAPAAQQAAPAKTENAAQPLTTQPSGEKPAIKTEAAPEAKTEAAPAAKTEAAPAAKTEAAPEAKADAPAKDQPTE